MASGTLQITLSPTRGSNGLPRRRVAASVPQLPLPHRSLLPSTFTWSSTDLRSRVNIIRASGTSNQEGSGGRGGFKSGSVGALSWTKPIFGFIADNFLPLALVSGVILGLADPTYGCLAYSFSLTKFSTFSIFIISGLSLRSDELCSAAEAWPAGLFGIASILLLSPLLSRLILQLKMTPQEFVNGLAIFFCMPTTLSSGVALTNLMKGNSSLALAITVISNLMGILLVPFLLSHFVGCGLGVCIPVMPLLKSLTITLLIPLIFGKVIRDSFSNVAQLVDQHRRYFSYANSILLSLVPWMQVSRSRALLLTIDLSAFLIVIAVGMLLHAVLLVFNTLALWSILVASNDNTSTVKMDKTARTVTIVASQKTLPVMVAVVEQLGGAFGDPALLVLPCVAAHISQIIIDSFLVNFWIHKDRLSFDKTP